MNQKLAAIAIIIGILGVAYFLSREANAPSEVGNLMPAPTEEAMMEDTTPKETGDTQSTKKTTTQTQTSTSKPKTSTQTTSPAPTPTPAPKPSPSLPYSATIYYDGGRFIPDEVTIIEGGTVRFVNSSAETDMWIVTNHHPTHALYGEKTESGCSQTTLDQCEAVGFNGSWSFTFNRTGRWGYHNEERPKDDGVVRVMTVEDFQTQIP